MLIIYSKFILQKQLDEGDPTGRGSLSSMNLLFLQQQRYCHSYDASLKRVAPARIIQHICHFFCSWIALTKRVKVKRAGLFYRLKLRSLFFRIIKILHVFWLSLIRYPIIQTSSSGVQFVEQGQLYKFGPATAGLKVCWQPTGQQWVATMGLYFPIFSVLIWKLRAGGFRQELKLFVCNQYQVGRPEIQQVTYNPSVVVVPSSGGNVSSSGFKMRRYTESSATAGIQVHGK